MTTENESRSKHVALARGDCPKCQGAGLASPEQTCACVYRGIFRAVLNKFRQCEAAGYLQPIILDGANAPRYRRSGHARKREEFRSDVYLTAVRTLTDLDELNLFKYHYLYGADWKLCCKRFGLPYHENKHRKLFFDRCYRIEAKLGRVYATLQPYSLYPVDEYFHPVTGRCVDTRPIPIPEQRHRNGIPVVAPLRPVSAPATDPFEAVKEEIRAAYKQGQTLTAICNDLNQRGVLPRNAAQWYPAILFRITGPRTERQPRAPAPVPVTLAPFDIGDSAAVAQHCRQGFSQGRSLKFLAAEMTRLNVPPANGKAQWTGSDVRAVLLNAPREQPARPRLRKAA